MKRRTLLITLPLASMTTTAAPGPSTRFAFDEATLAALAARLQGGRVSAKALAAAYEARIAAIDQRAPRINAVIEINPDALPIAAELDRERKIGRVRGPLHGIPVLIKDNIATADRMQTTAGSLAFVGVKPPRDAFIVKRLREAGAVILGKNNLSEWANFRSTRSVSGWSARGGLTRNPYALDRNSSGSSSGTAVAIAANLAAVGIGTETDGSIVSPASACGVVGFKPTVGLVSRDGIVPISHSQDTAGPITRTVTDAAVLLTVIAGGEKPADDYSRRLDVDGLRGARIGVARNFMINHPATDTVFEGALRTMAARGATLIDPALIPNTDKLSVPELEVLLAEFKAGLATYLAEFAPGAPIKSLSDLIAFNQQHAAREMPFFAQELFERAAMKGDLNDSLYRDAHANCRKFARDEGLDAVLREHRLDALVAPTRGPAWLTDFVLGDRPGPGFSQPAAVAGYPHITVPMGFVSGLPVGLSFVGAAGADGPLLKFAYAFEQASPARRPPQFLKTAEIVSA